MENKNLELANAGVCTEEKSKEKLELIFEFKSDNTKLREEQYIVHMARAISLKESNQSAVY